MRNWEVFVLEHKYLPDIGCTRRTRHQATRYKR